MPSPRLRSKHLHCTRCIRGTQEHITTHETPADIQRLDLLLSHSIERAGSFLRSSFEMPAHSLSARQLAHYLQDRHTVALATVTARGEPRVAPIGSLFWRSHFYIPTVLQAARTRHIRARPAISLTHYAGIDLAVIVHGRAIIISPESPDFAALDALHQETAGESVQNWGEGVYLRIDPDVMYSYARYPESFPE